MGRSEEEKVTVVEQGVYPVPDIPIKDLLDSIPSVLSPYLPHYVPFAHFLSIEPTVSDVLH
jgi:hypothetical protein